MSDCCCNCNDDICCMLKRFVGQTVTIFTKSGGCSGSGYTGVVIYVDECTVKLLTRVGGAPDCPLGSDCGYPDNCGCGFGNYAYGCGGNRNRNNRNNRGCCGYDNILGSVTEIPICSIASFVHNAI